MDPRKETSTAHPHTDAQTFLPSTHTWTNPNGKKRSVCPWDPQWKVWRQSWMSAGNVQLYRSLLKSTLDSPKNSPDYERGLGWVQTRPRSPTSIHALREWAFLQSFWTGQGGLSKQAASRGLKSISALGFSLSWCTGNPDTAMSMIKKSKLICSRLRGHLRPWCPRRLSQKTDRKEKPS